MATKTGLGITRSQLDAGRKKIAATLKSAALEDLYHSIPTEMASLLGAGGIRFGFRDTLPARRHNHRPQLACWRPAPEAMPGAALPAATNAPKYP